MATVITARGEATVEKGALKFRLTMLDADSAGMHSTFGSLLSWKPLKTLLHEILKHIVVPLVNKKMPAIPLPSPAGVEFVDASVGYASTYIRVATNLDLSHVVWPDIPTLSPAPAVLLPAKAKALRGAADQ